MPERISVLALACTLLFATTSCAAPARSTAPAPEDVTAALVTLAKARHLAIELDYHHANHGRYPEANTPHELAVELGSYPFLMEHLLVDGWGRPMRLVTSPDGSFYRLVSAGADGVFEEGDVVGAGQQVTDLGRDLVYSSAGVLRTWEDAAVAAAERLDPHAVEVWQERLDATRVKRAIAELRNLGTALMSYGVDHERFPSVAEVEELGPYLVPIYIREVVGEDPWGTPFRVAVSLDGSSVQLISAGADGLFEPETWEEEAELADPARDAVWKDGMFVRIWKLPSAERGAMAEALEVLLEMREMDSKPLRRDPERLAGMRRERTEERLRAIADELGRAVAESGSCPDGGTDAVAAVLSERQWRMYRGALPIPEDAPQDYRELVEQMRLDAAAGAALLRLVDEWGKPLEVECVASGPVRVRSPSAPELEAEVSREEIAARREEEARWRQPTEPPRPVQLPEKRYDTPGAPAGLEGPVRKRAVAPVYPAEARQQGLGGTVALSLVVTTRGTVTAIEVVDSANKLLDEAAIEAVRQWQFEPARLDGNPVPFKLALTFNFEPE